jgi:hypothetical protein
MSQTGSIQGAKIGSYNNMNDPTYPGPDGKMFTWKRNVALHLAQTRPPKSVYEYIDLGSEIFDLPPSYKAIEATIVATPEKKKDPGARGHYWIDSPGGEALKRLCFTEDGALLENASVGTAARRAAPCKISAVVRKSLEQHCYVQVMRFIDLKEEYPGTTAFSPTLQSNLEIYSAPMYITTATTQSKKNRPTPVLCPPP